MEQGLSFIGVVAIISIGIVTNSALWIITSFIVGSLYLLWRGKKKGWSWKR